MCGTGVGCGWGMEGTNGWGMGRTNGWGSCPSIHQSSRLSALLSYHMVCPSSCLILYLPNCLSVCLSVLPGPTSCLSIYLSIYPSTQPPVHYCISLLIHVSVCLSNCPLCLSVYLFINPSIFPSLIHPSVLYIDN